MDVCCGTGASVHQENTRKCRHKKKFHRSSGTCDRDREEDKSKKRGVEKGDRRICRTISKLRVVHAAAVTSEASLSDYTREKTTGLKDAATKLTSHVENEGGADEEEEADRDESKDDSLAIARTRDVKKFLVCLCPSLDIHHR